MGKFVIKTGTDGQFYFTLKADNGQKLLGSEGYTSKAGCMNGIESVKTNSQDESKYEKKTSSNEKYYFNLKATNGQIIGTTDMYETSAGRDNGIAVVKSTAPDASIEEAE